MLNSLCNNSLTFEFASNAIDGYKHIDSCMNGKVYVKFYDRLNKEFPDLVRVLLLIENGEVIGRALVWNLKYFTAVETNRPVRLQHKLEEKYLVDRIYPSDNSNVISSFKNYATENKCLTKYRQSYDCQGSFVKSNGDNINIKMHLPKNISHIAAEFETPYLDTFDSINEFGYLSNALGSNSKRFTTLRSTNGSINTNYKNYLLDCVIDNNKFRFDSKGQIAIDNGKDNDDLVCPICGKVHTVNMNVSSNLSTPFSSEIDARVFYRRLGKDELISYLEKRNLFNFTNIKKENISICLNCMKNITHKCDICGKLVIGNTTCESCVTNNIKKCKICGATTSNEKYCDSCETFIKKMDANTFLDIMKDQ